MSKEQALARLIMVNTRLTKEANTVRGETKKSLKEYDTLLKEVCGYLDIDPKDVEKIVNPE